MNKKMVTILGLVVLIALVAAGVAVTRQKTVSGTNAFRLATNTWVGYGPLYLAQEKGYFKDEGVDVTMTVMEDVAQRKTALVKGDVDAEGDTVDSLILARDQKVPAVATMEFDVSNGADGILTTDAIKSVQDLKGKKIAVQRNFISEAFLDYVLGKNGLKPSDVQKIDTEAGAAGAAFVSGSVDVAVTYEPWLTKSKERKGAKVLVSSADEKGVVVDILSVSQDYLTKNPENVQKVMRAWFRALDYWKAHPDEADEIMGKHYNLSKLDFADYVSGLVWPSYDENAAYFGTPANNGRFYQVADIFSGVFLGNAQIQSKPDMSAAVNADLLKTLYGSK